MNIIGRCIINVDFIKKNMPQIIKDEYTSEDKDIKRKYWQHLYSIWGNNQRDNDFKIINSAYNMSFPCFQRNTSQNDDFQKNFNKWLEEINNNELVLKCYYKDDLIAVVGYSYSEKSCFMFPVEFVTVKEYKNYDKLTGTERRQMLTGAYETVNAKNREMINYDESAKTELLRQKTEKQKQVEKLQEQMQDVKNAKTEELAELQAEIDKKIAELEDKKKNMMSVLEKKKSAMELALEKMNFDIFKLDSEIYAIRCYTGEVLELKKVCSGKCANEDTPMIFHQKMRYLDEELGKLASLYNVDYSDVNLFEEILKERRDIAEYFAPSDRSVMLVRVSRTNRIYGHSEKYLNMLECYKKYHGAKVGIIIRDGENLYIAWTDDDRIYFSDDAFYKPGEIEVSACDLVKLEKGRYETEQEYQKRMRSEKMKELRNQLGRYYVFALLQGIIDRNIIKFPEKIYIKKTSPYIVWSYADGWITTNEYGTFTNMIERCNKSVKAGDMILMTDSARPERATSFWGSGAWVSQAYHNDRGIGDKNRTHDVMAYNNEIYPVNLVKHTAKYEYDITYNSEETEKRCNVWDDSEYREFANRKDWSRYAYVIENIKKQEGTDEYEIYISLEKNENWMTGKSSRANFNVYKDEFINLTFMNSVWLEYVLTNHKDGRIRIHGETVDFAYVIPYIKRALAYVKKREEQFAEWIKQIDETVLNDKKWPVKLSEWMLTNDIHNFSPFRAKQFTNYYNKNKHEK